MIRARNKIGISILFLCFFWTGAANASTWFGGTAVGAAGSDIMV